MQRAWHAGPYVIGIAETQAERRAALALRALAFRGGRASDEDRFDGPSLHLLIRRPGDEMALAAARIMPFATAAAAVSGYTGQFYDLRHLAHQPGPWAEMGRICLHPGHRTPELPRLMWAAITATLHQLETRFLFGCSSFPGAALARHAPALAYLHQHALGPRALCPPARIPNHQPVPHGTPPDPRGLPPLLRLYLGLGAWVGADHVLDPDLDTLHIFTALDFTSITPRQRQTFARINALLHA